MEAWFNLGGLMAERGRREAARRHLAKAIALDPGYADAVYNLATLEYEAGSLREARRWWERYLELDPHSEWGRIAARGVRFAALSARAGRQGLRWTSCATAPPTRGSRCFSPTAPGRRWTAPSMTAAARALAAAGLGVARFEFAYMAGRRGPAGRKPPPRAETLIGEYRDAVAALGAAGPLVIGGKSMGGRVASMAADELHAAGRVAGLLCLGYPFHPPGRPERLRTAPSRGARARRR